VTAVQIRFLGHACFELVDGSATVLIDPFLAPDNPAATVTASDVEPTDILLTHGHRDHVGSTIEIAKRTGARCLAVTELADWLYEQGVENVADPNLGGTVETDWGSVKVLPALHTNTVPDGGAIGVGTSLLVRIGEVTIHHLGDTWLFGDMRLIGERERADIALMPIGGHYTMDRADAVFACEMLRPGTVIPCHYDTFPPIASDAEAFKRDVEAATESSVVVLKPGESLQV
jgi:L-ascorbate metabolism protein UlaG (beta-lactamase superfamily)